MPRWKSPALALVNSEHWYGRGAERREDQLALPGWVERYLEEWQLTPERNPSKGDRRELVALRGLLRRTVTTLHDGGEIAANLAELRPYVERGLLRRRLVADASAVHVDLVPVRRDWDWVLGEIASSFARLLADDGADRIKLCANEECGWTFYDESKNGRRRWCDMQICGNVAKVRRFRARRAGRSDAAHQDAA